MGSATTRDCDNAMNAQRAMKHYKRHRTFYMDAAGHRALYKLIKRQAKIIEQAKCTTADACARCESEYQDAGTCLSCHVWRLVQVIRKEEERDDSKTCD